MNRCTAAPTAIISIIVIVSDALPRQSRSGRRIWTPLIETALSFLSLSPFVISLHYYRVVISAFVVSLFHFGRGTRQGRPEIASPQSKLGTGN